MGRKKVRSQVIPCPGSGGKLIVWAQDDRGTPLYGVSITAASTDGRTLESFTQGVRGPAVAKFGTVPPGEYDVYFRGAATTARRITVRAPNEHSLRDPNLVLQWRVRARLRTVTPAEFWPPTDLLARYTLEDPDGVVTGARIQIRDRQGTMVHSLDVPHDPAPVEPVEVEVWDGTGATVEAGPYHVRLEVRDPIRTHRSERVVRLREASVAVRVIDCFHQRPVRGAQVDFGVEDQAAAATFQDPEDLDSTYGVVRSAETDKNGMAVLSKLEPYVGEVCAVRVRAGGYHHPHHVERPEVFSDVGVQTHERVEVEVVLVGEDPSLPPDLETTVGTFLESVPSMRLVVEQGPNFGNQAAALALLRNLRRLGYTGRIDAYADAEPTLYESVCNIQMSARTGEHLTGDEMAELLAGRLRDLYDQALEITETESHDTGGGVGGNRGRVNLTATVRYLDRVYFEEDSARLAGELGAIPYPATVTIDQDPTVLNGVHRDDERDTKPWQMTIDLTFVSVSEPPVSNKLSRLDPDFRTAIDNVAWHDGKNFPEPAEDDRVVGLLAGGEFSKFGMHEIRRNTLKTHSVLALQPFWWHPATRLVAVDGQEVQELCLPLAATYRQEPLGLSVEDLNRLLADHCGEAAPGLQRALGQVDAGQLDLMMVYGVHQPHYSSTRVLVENLVRGVRHGQESGEIRKAMILLICKVDVSADVPADDGVLRNAYDGTLDDAVENLGDGRLLFVQTVAALHNQVFQALCEASTLPVILEGANTANLMQMLAVPYLSVASKTTPYLDVPTDGNDGHLRLKELEALFNTDGLDGDGLTQLATYFDAARNRQSVLDGYFANLRTYMRERGRDQVLLGLYKLAEALG